MNLETKIEKIPRIGKIYQERLKKLNIKTVRDLIFHFPHRYDDFSKIIPIKEIKINESVCIQGKILEIENKRTWKKRIIVTQAVVQDKTGAIKVVWFNQSYLTRSLKLGDYVCLAGKVVLKDNGAYLSSPAYEKLPQGERFSSDLTHTGRLVPIYPETEGLSSRWLRYILKPLLKELKNKILEILPDEILKKENLMPVQQAIWQIHFPDSEKLATKAQQRFAFEELFLLQLRVLKEKIKISQEKAISISLDLKTVKKFVDSLPFKLTNAQKKCAWQILKDSEKTRPMSRLLQGDVGSGKTVVATMAALNTAQANHQIAFMAPTEILAKQHFQNISQILKNFDVNIGLLTSKEAKIFSEKKEKKISRTKLLKHLKEKEIKFLIGTHALIQKNVKFERLTLVILDEQHRFGVEQRAKLVQQTAKIPHLLSMTATPIPRSLALSIYGDLDLCLIDEMPKGRKKIITKIVPPEKRKNAYDFIRKQVKNGRQVFVICPRIEAKPAEIAISAAVGPKGRYQYQHWDVKAVKEEYKKLAEKVFPDLKIEMLHGRMKTEEKEKIMTDFKNKKTDVLVSTSVVEVGIDIPNATVMMIEGAERFGLAQLHQFRGRVGRSEYQSYCFLFTDSSAIKTRKRLTALVKSENGFELAEMDLKIRGPGDFLGTRQSGIPDLVMNALKNIKLVEKTREAAREILQQDPELKRYPPLKEKLKKFEQRIHLE